jgi:GTP 3',8-cyclase
MIQDSFGRQIRYLRVAVTDACDLRCKYCMPDDMRFYAAEHLMRDDEILRLIRLFASLGFNKVRFTGGEPTLRPGLVELVAAVRAVAGLAEIGLTTNGVRLAELAAPLRAAGLQRVNVSLDATDPETFRRISGRDQFREVWRGLEAAEAAGLGIKLNSVVVRGLNDGRSVVELARLTLSRSWQVRFIELMPFGALHEFQRDRIVPEAELRSDIVAALGPLTSLHDGALDGEARIFKLPDAKGELGFISSVSQPFCAQCGRVRLMANGILRLCLLRDDEVNLLGPLRAGAGDDDLRELIADAVRRKPWGHEVREGRYATNRTASQIGG